MGTAIYIIRDSPRALSQNLAMKIKRRIRRSDHIAHHLNRVVEHSRRTMNDGSFEYRRATTHALENYQRQHEVCRDRLTVTERTQAYFQAMLNEAKGLQIALQSLDMTEQRPGILSQRSIN